MLDTVLSALQGLTHLVLIMTLPGDAAITLSFQMRTLRHREVQLHALRFGGLLEGTTEGRIHSPICLCPQVALTTFSLPLLPTMTLPCGTPSE